MLSHVEDITLFPSIIPARPTSDMVTLYQRSIDVMVKINVRLSRCFNPVLSIALLPD